MAKYDLKFEFSVLVVEFNKRIAAYEVIQYYEGVFDLAVLVFLRKSKRSLQHEMYGRREEESAYKGILVGNSI